MKTFSNSSFSLLLLYKFLTSGHTDSWIPSSVYSMLAVVLFGVIKGLDSGLDEPSKMGELEIESVAALLIMREIASWYYRAL